MIRLFKAEAFRDFENKPNAPEFLYNGDILLEPTECYSEATLNGTWQLTMSHGHDPEGRYSYIEEDDVIVVDCKIAREQTSDVQAFRVIKVRPQTNKIDVTAIPIAWESIYETPIDTLNLALVSPNEYLDRVKNGYVNTRKYTIDMQYSSTRQDSLVIQNSNLQEILNGDQEGSFKTLYGTELVYDNYTYHILPNLGTGNTPADATKYRIEEGLNLSGIDMEVSTEDMVTRIYPTSYEGYTLRGEHSYVESMDSKLKIHPFPFAKSINYDNIKFIDIPETDNGNSTETEPLTETQKATEEAIGAIAAKVEELSKKYLLKARNGDWDYSGKYADMDAQSNNPHDPGAPYNLGRDRKALPFGYIFYSYNDAMAVLADDVIHANFEETSPWEGGFTDETITGEHSGSQSGTGFDGDDIWQNEDGTQEYMVITDSNEKTMIQEAIKRGFKWCETTDIAEWDWRFSSTYSTESHPDFNFLKDYRWIEDENGWFYGDGEGHFIQNGWVEDDKCEHYWVGEDGYWDDQYDDFEPWQWWAEGEKWWYGNKNTDGSTKNYAKEQYIQDTESGNWYWFNGSGWYVEPENKKWWYGTKDGADTIMFKYHKVGNHIWWFDTQGNISDTLAYLDNYEWRTDETGNYYGDGCGHWFSNAWVEDSASSHRWVNELGYEDETKKDTNEWTWHGSWENGWWYGNDEDDEEDDSSDSSSDNSSSDDSSSNNTSDDTKTVLSRIKTICDNGDNYTKSTFITAVENELEAVSYSKSSSLGQIDTCIHAGYNKTYMINQIDGIINASGYDFDTDDKSDDNSTSPSGNTNTTTENAHNYVKNQFLYVTENKTWYWFDEQGYMTAAWLTDADWEWHQDSKGWYYGDDKGTYPAGQWMKINSKWYFFDMSGYADDSTDDFEESKTDDGNSATYDNNREGIGTVSYKDDVEDVAYDRDRDGVKAWIQNDFVRDLYTCVMEQHENLLTLMEAQLKEAAEIDLESLEEPAVSITIDFQSLEDHPMYEQFEFLGDLYLGDHVYYKSDSANVYGIQRVTSIKKDCITGKIAEITFSNEAWIRNGNKLIPGLSKTVNTPGKIITYVPQDPIEDGYGGFLKTGYGVDLTTL